MNADRFKRKGAAAAEQEAAPQDAAPTPEVTPTPEPATPAGKVSAPDSVSQALLDEIPDRPKGTATQDTAAPGVDPGEAPAEPEDEPSAPESRGPRVAVVVGAGVGLSLLAALMLTRRNVAATVPSAPPAAHGAPVPLATVPSIPGALVIK